MCDCTFEIPMNADKLFNKVHQFPCKPYIKVKEWQFIIGFRNVEVINIYNYTRFS